MSASAKRQIRFADFEADFVAGELRKSGKPVRLQEQPFRILKSLLERPGQIVTREELRRDVWADDVHVDFDRGLNTSVARLREALGDSPNRPAYIETIPRKGYRFIAAIEGDSEGAQAPEVAGRTSARSKTLIAAVALALAAVLLAASWPNRSPETAGDPALTAEPLTYYEGVEGEADFSPDGSQVVFTWNGESQANLDVYIKTIEGSEPIRLTDDPLVDFGPAWSPDGQWIAFLRRIDGQRAGVYRIPALGGREEKLTEVTLPTRFGGMRMVLDRHLCWAADSESLVLVDKQSDDEVLSLYLFSAKTGGKRRLTRAPTGSFGDRNPALSPDGRTLAFNGSRGTSQGLFLLALGEQLSPSGEPEFVRFDEDRLKRAFRRFSYPMNPDWLNAEELVVTIGQQLWRINAKQRGDPDLAGTVAGGQVSLPGARGYLPSASVSGNRLVFTSPVHESNIWRVNLDQNHIGSAPSRVLSSTAAEINFHYSPDGRRLVFQSSRSDRYDIWISNADGSGASPLVGSGGSPRWAPSGEIIAFDAPSDPGNRATFDIWSISPEGGAPRRLTSPGPDHRLPSWSQDGGSIYYASNQEDGFQIWKKNLRTGEEARITRGGGWAAIEAPNGDVYYTKARQDFSVWRRSAESGQEVQVLEPLLSFNPFTISEAGIFHMPRRGKNGRSSIMFYDFSDGSNTLVFVPEKPLSAGISVSPDGSHVLFSQIDREGSDLMLVEGFR